MKKIIVLIVFALTCLPAGADESHAKHFAATGAISSITCAAFKANGKPILGAIAGVSTAMLIGHGKESTDPYYDDEDMSYNASGSVMGASICLSF